MSRFSEHRVEFDSRNNVIALEYEDEEEITGEPDTSLYYEASGSERFPTFSVRLVIEKQELGQRIFQSESDAILCLKTLYPILSKVPVVALQEFQAWCPG